MKVRIRSAEHGAWWRPFGRGYTSETANAGLFTPEYAASVVAKSGPEKQLEIHLVADPDEFVFVEWVDTAGVSRRWLAPGAGSTVDCNLAHAWRRADAEELVRVSGYNHKLIPAPPPAPDLVSPWVPMSDPVDLKHLGKLAEELAEAGAAVARCLVQGIDESEPVTGKPNEEWLEDELADVLANIDLVVARFGLNRGRMVTRADRKKVALRKWHDMTHQGAGQ